MCTRLPFLAAFIVPFVAGTALAQGVLPVTVIPIKHSKPADIVSIIDQVYEEGPMVIAEALPKLGAVAIRADAKTTQEIRKLVEEIELSNRIAVFRSSSDHTDHAAMMKIVRMIRAAQASPEFILAGAAAGDAYVNAASGFGSFAPGAFATPSGGGGRPGGGGFRPVGGSLFKFAPLKIPVHIQLLGGIGAQRTAR